MISPALFVLAKAVFICILLVFLNVVGRKTATLYFAGVMALFFLKGNFYIAETVLKNTVILYFVFVFVYAIAKKTVLRKEEEQVKYPGKNRKQLESYLLFFLAMFFYNSVLIILFESQKVSFLLSAVFFFFIEVLSQRLSRNKIMKLFGANKILFYFLADIYFFAANYSMGSLDNALILLFLLFAFNIITDSFAIWCPTGELLVGMIPAEFVVKKNRKLVKQNIPLFINSIFRQKIMNNYFEKKEMISPFRPLTCRDIDKLKASEIETLKIQKTINLSIFVIFGIALSYLLF
ncbi:MAG: hypothetical protein DRN66_00580 [Candidatus Nanohalarchaeota archaeon]|nr:MAG: hypothetical protein DRN66_00580 [Candidatus Nanohaloarchaeota archaeon]